MPNKVDFITSLSVPILKQVSVKISWECQRKSIIITGQLPFKAWYEYIGEPTLADAIMDRLTAGAHKIELKGESLRKRKK